MAKAKVNLPPVVDTRKWRYREALHRRLRGVYEELNRLQDSHHETGFGCQRAGHCCRVGLELHIMECEHIARHLEARFHEHPEDRPEVIGRLLGAFQDDAWTWARGSGEMHCAFFTGKNGGGCTIYGDRPAVCRMYGVVLDIDDVCPRTRLTSGDPFLYRGPDVDRLVNAYYAILDEYGQRFPDLDYTVFMPAGVLRFLLTPEELREVRRNTPRKFWYKEEGYRCQFQPYEETGGDVTLPKQLRVRVPE